MDPSKFTRPVKRSYRIHVVRNGLNTGVRLADFESDARRTNSGLPVWKNR